MPARPRETPTTNQSHTTTEKGRPVKYYDATHGTLLKALIMSFQTGNRLETILKQMESQVDESWDTLANKLQRDLVEGVRDRRVRALASAKGEPPPPPIKSPLIDAAQDVLKDERHWSLVDVADRAEAAKGLAEMILTTFGADEGSCPDDCKDCREHGKNTS